MAGTFTYLYSPNQRVHVIVECTPGVLSIQEGLILRVRFDALVTGTNLMYDIRVGNQVGTKAFPEEVVFSTKLDAITSYQALV